MIGYDDCGPIRIVCVCDVRQTAATNQPTIGQSMLMCGGDIDDDEDDDDDDDDDDD